MKKIALLGSGALSKAISSKISSDTFDRSDVNYIDGKFSAEFIDNIVDYDVIVNCVGTMHGTVNEILTVNAVTPIVLLENLVNKQYQGHVIMIGSHASSWTSWPGIELDRLVYNNSKLALKNFVMGLSHSNLTTMKITLVDASRFQSEMSNFQGYNVEDIAQIVADLATTTSTVRVLHVETY